MTSKDPITNQALPSEAIQRILYIAPRVHVYRIPPLTSTRGFNAASWTQNPKDLLITARLRILETAIPLSSSSSNPSSVPFSSSSEPAEKVTTTLLLEDPTSGDLFAACPYTSPASVQQALDSSRFFAVRVVGEGGMKATLGIGFEERSDAFDFNVVLEDARRVLGMDGSVGTGVLGGGKTAKGAAGRGRAERDVGREGGGGGGVVGAIGSRVDEKHDFSLKEGETITVNIGGRGRRIGASNDSAAGKGAPTVKSDSSALFSIRPPPGNGANPPAIPFLPPPPSAQDVKAERRKNRPAPAEQQASTQVMGFDDGEFGEFGEFQ